MDTEQDGWMGPDMTARVTCSLWTLPVEAIRWYLETFVVTTREWRVWVPGWRPMLLFTPL